MNQAELILGSCHLHCQKRRAFSSPLCQGLLESRNSLPLSLGTGTVYPRPAEHPKPKSFSLSLTFHVFHFFYSRQDAKACSAAVPFINSAIFRNSSFSLPWLNSTPSLDNGGHSQEDRLWRHSQVVHTELASQRLYLGKFLDAHGSCSHNYC